VTEPNGVGTANATTTTGTDHGPPPELLDWLRGLVQDGLCLPLDGGRYRLRLSQAALARHMGLSPGAGTLSRRLRALTDCGVVLSRRPLVFRLPDVTRATPQIESSTVQTDVDLLTRLTALCTQAVASRSDDVVLAALGCLAQALRGPAPLADSARGQRGSSSIVSTDFTTDCATVTTAATTSARSPLPSTTSASPPAPSIIDPARAAEVFGAIEPLLAVCDRLGLPGVTNPRGLLHAVMDVERNDLEHGARLIADQLRANVPLRSPVGVLIALARRGDLCGVASLGRDPGSAPDPRRTEPYPGATTESADGAERGEDQQPEVADPWWAELTRLERDDPAALCRLTGDAQPWLAKLRAYTRAAAAPAQPRSASALAVSGRHAAEADGDQHDLDPVPCDP
jgi:hypothetical protein